MSDFENEDGFQEERGAIERVGGQRDALNDLISKLIDERTKTLEGKIKFQIWQIWNQDNSLFSLNDLISKVNQIDNLKYKNALGLVLGYISCNDKGQVDDRKFEQAKKELNLLIKNKNLELGYVSEYDILKYARFWSLHWNV